MKKIFLLFGMIAAFVSFSQSTDLDKQEIKISYVELPVKPILEPKNRTYSFVLSTDRYLMYDKSKFFFQNQVTISGFEKKEKNGYLSIDVTLINPVITKKDISTRTSSSKDRNGVVRNKYFYTANVSYTQEGIAKVSSADGTVSEIINFAAQRAHNSMEYENYSQAESYLYGANRIVNNTYLNEVISTLNNQLNFNFGYRIKNGVDYLWILANKKHPEQNAEFDAYLQVKNVFDKVAFNQSVAGFEEEMAKAIVYFEGLPKKFTADEKGDRKIRYSAYYNLAVIYKYLDKPEKAIEWSNKLIANDYDKRDGDNLIKDCNNLIDLFKRNKVNSTHFPVETKSFVFEEVSVTPSQSGGYNQTSAPYSIETDSNYIMAYLMTIKKDTVVGYVPKSRAMNLTESISLTVKDFQGKYSERVFKANEVNKITFSNGEEYATVSFKLATDNGGVNMSSASKKFVKELFVGKKIGIYQYFNGEVIIKMANDSEGKSNASASWMLGPKKRFEEMAAGCSSLLERVDKKEFKNNLDSILAFAEALEACK